MVRDPAKKEMWACIDCGTKREVYLSQYAKNGRTKESYVCFSCHNKRRFGNEEYRTKQIALMNEGK